MRSFQAGWISASVVGVVLLLVGSTALATTAWQYSVPQVRLPLMKAPPIKGAVKPAQWAGADEMTGFNNNAAGGALVPWAAHFWVGGNAKDLFIAIVSQTPPGGKLLDRVNSLPFGTNAQMIMIDDTVEILVDPSPHAKNSRIFQLVVNAKGAIWQQAISSRGSTAKAWHGHWRIANKIVGDRWDCQVAIPWKDFGIKHIAGQTVGIRIGRDWLQVPRGGWVQSQWSPQGGGYADPSTMPLVTFAAAVPVVQVRQLQNKPNHPANIQVAIGNPSARPLHVRASMVIVPRAGRQLIQRMAILHPGVSSYRKPTVQNQTLTLAPHQTKIVGVRSTAVAGEPLYTQIQVSSADAKVVYYKRNFAWKINRPARLWSLNKGANKRIDTAFAYYPSYNEMQVKVNLSDLANRAKVTAVKLQVRDQKTGQIIAATTMPPLQHYVTRIHAWKLPPLKGQLIRATNNDGGFLHEWKQLPLNGKYQLVVQLEGIRAKPQVLPFVRYHFTWEHNQLGRADIVVPPFTPLQVHGKTVSVVLRKYTMNGLGLWSQVNAADQNLLSKPMRMVVRAGGKRFVGHGQLKFTQIKPTQVIAVAHWQAGPLKGSSRSVWDYDGMMKTTLTLEPTKETLDSVSLVIPMVNKEMPLMTACTDGVRFNYAGKTPVGSGEVWNGSEAPRNFIIGSFVPYIWTGGPLRGVAVFGDNDRGWVDYMAKTPCQELVRKPDGTLELRLNLVAKPARPKTVHKIVLGFQATPIKPMPKGWRLWTMNNNFPGAYRMVFAGNSLYWGSLENDAGDLYPRRGNFSIYQQFERTRRTGKIPYGFLKKWLAGYPRSGEGLDKNLGPSIGWLFGGLAGKPRRVIVYTNPAGVRLDRPAGQTYLNQWDDHRFPTRRWPYGGHLNFTVNPDKSFRDYALWYYDKMLTTFDDGIYWDNTFLKSNFSTLGDSDAYRLPDGYIQPGGSLWATRALFRRTAILDAQLHKPDLNMVHMTNDAVAPILAFAGIDLDWEWHVNESAFQDRFSRSFILTESLGRQFGNVPCVLEDMAGHNPKKLAWARHTWDGICLTYELAHDGGGPGLVRDLGRLAKFGYGTPRTKVWNYWRHNYPMRAFGDKTSSIIVSKRVGKGGQAIIVVCDWGHGGTIRLKLNAARLHLVAGRLMVTNMETKKRVQIAADGAIMFHLKKDDFVMLLVKADK